MKFGISEACYRWITYPPSSGGGAPNNNIFDPAFLATGWGLPYTSSLTSLKPGEEPQWLLDKTAELGRSPLYMSPKWFANEGEAVKVKEYAQEKGVELIGNTHANYITEGKAWESEKERFIHLLRLNKAMGANMVAATHSGALIHNHFTTDPPVGEQIRLMIKHFRELLPYAEEIGIVIAFENHMDYRCSEVAAVVGEINSPWLRVNFDTANPYCVIEDPLDAVEAVAEWTVMAHLKDMRVQPVTQIGAPKVLWAPIGRGTVPVGEILEILNQKAPDPVNMPLCIETAPPPDHDPDIWVKMGVDYVRSEFGSYLK